MTRQQEKTGCPAGLSTPTRKFIGWDSCSRTPIAVTTLSKEEDSVINTGSYIADISGIEVHEISEDGTSFSVLPGSQQRHPLGLDNPNEVTEELAKTLQAQTLADPPLKQHLYATITASTSEQKFSTRSDECPNLSPGSPLKLQIFRRL